MLAPVKLRMPVSWRLYYCGPRGTRECCVLFRADTWHGDRPVEHRGMWNTVGGGGGGGNQGSESHLWAGFVKPDDQDLLPSGSQVFFSSGSCVHTHDVCEMDCIYRVLFLYGYAAPSLFCKTSWIRECWVCAALCIFIYFSYLFIFLSGETLLVGTCRYMCAA